MSPYPSPPLRLRRYVGLKTALSLSDRLYQLGAVEVLAFGETITASLAVELPADPAKRKALLDFEKEHNARRTPTADVGQKYMLLHMM